MTLKGTRSSKPPRRILGGFDMRSTVDGPLPHIPFKEIWRTILGDNYDLSLVICGDKLSRRINQEYRPAFAKTSAGKHKNYSPNVLSFPLDKHSGEIFLNIRKAEREAKEMGMSVRQRTAHLYVHGCFHLAGYDHSPDMERREDVILTLFKLI